MTSYLLCILFFYTCTCTQVLADDSNTADEVGLTTAEIVRLRGYIAINHYVATDQGYIVNVVEVRSPLIKEISKNREPVLFIHGIQTTINCFIVNSVGARPKDHSKLKVANMTDEEIYHLLGDDPASNSLPFTLVNFGYVVFLLNRRGTRESLGHILPDHQAFEDSIGEKIKEETQELIDKVKPDIFKLIGLDKISTLVKKLAPSFGILDPLNHGNLFTNYSSLRSNPRYWNYSLDEQARYDVPSIIDFVLEQTGRKKLAIVGHSVGGALPLMSLTLYPELSKKLTKGILWAPSLDLGDTINVHPLSRPTIAFEKELIEYKGPFLPAPLAALVKQIVATLCKAELAHETVCRASAELVFGIGGTQQNLSPGISSVFFDPISSHELVSLIQSVKKGIMHFFDFNDSGKNMVRYGTAKPPPYDIGRIKSKSISFWYGNKDIIVSPKDIEVTVRRSKVPIQRTFINETGILFNHASFFTHLNVSRLLILPCLKTLETKS